MKNFRYMIEAAFLYVAFGIFYVLGPQMASALGGWVGRTLGPKMGASKKALSNLRHAMPDKTEDEYAAILLSMWDNLGRVMAEYPHLKTIARKYVQVEGLANVPVDQSKPFVLITGHLANWEVAHVSMFVKAGVKFHLVYRPPNNHYIGDLVEKCRRVDGQLSMFAKSRTGTRGMVEAMAEGNPLLILIDQKYNEGIAAPFMGRPAMTSDAFVRFSQKFAAPIIPFRMERLHGCHFRLSLHPAIPAEGRTAEDVIGDAHRLLEGWIREKPGQWLWLHRRWDSAGLK